MANDAEMFPLASTVTNFEYDGALQLTEISELTTPPSWTVGWLASLLHSRMFPIDLAVNPVPVTVTVWPAASPVAGATVIEGAAYAGTVPMATSPPPSVSVKSTREHHVFTRPLFRVPTITVHHHTVSRYDPFP